MEKRFLSIRQASEYSSLSTRFLYELCRDKKIRYFKINKRIVIQVADLQEFITQNVVDPVDWNEKARELNR